MQLEETSHEVRNLFVALELARARSARAVGRSPAELSTLTHVRLGTAVTPHAIATRLSLTTGSVTALLDRLQAAGLIERQANPEDRRSLIIVATATGQQLADDFLSSIDKVVLRAVDGVDASTVVTLQEVLRGIIEGVSGPDFVTAG